MGKTYLLRKASVKCLYQLKTLQCFAKCTEINELQTFLTRLSNETSVQGLCELRIPSYVAMSIVVHTKSPVQLCMRSYNILLFCFSLLLLCVINHAVSHAIDA